MTKKNFLGFSVAKRIFQRKRGKAEFLSKCHKRVFIPLKVSKGDTAVGCNVLKVKKYLWPNLIEKYELWIYGNVKAERKNLKL